MRRNHALSEGQPTGVASRRPSRAAGPRRLVAAVTAVAALALLVAACGGSSSSSSSGGKASTNPNNANTAQSSLGTVLYGTLPPAGTPKAGGVITQGQLTGQTPTYIMPIVPGAN